MYHSPRDVGGGGYVYTLPVVLEGQPVYVKDRPQFITMVTKVQKRGRDVGQVVLVTGPILSYL